ISYCTADKTQDKVFAYVSQIQFNETLECHAFLCHKKKITKVRRPGSAARLLSEMDRQRLQTHTVSQEVEDDLDDAFS
ncbi:unnamed protein product, partial [Coregonus sp. 'balchen']